MSCLIVKHDNFKHAKFRIFIILNLMGKIQFKSFNSDQFQFME